MRVFVFQSQKDATIISYTAQPDGTHLPAELAPWHFLGEQVQQPGGHIAGVPDGANTVIAVIEAEGCFVTDILPREASQTA